MENIRKAIEAKRKKYEAQGHADKDFEKDINGVRVKMWLPESVFVQQTMLLIAGKAMSSGSGDIDEEANLKRRYMEAVAKHTKIDAEMLNIEKAGLADCEAYAMMYWTELLCPLSMWVDSRAEKMISS